MRKSILLLSYQYPPTVGGAGIVAQDTARLFSKSHQVTVVTLDKNQSTDEAFPVELASTQWPFRFIGFWKAIKHKNLQQFDEIILNDTGASLVAALFFTDDIKSKCWVYLHGSEPENIFLNPELMFKLLRFKQKYIQLLHCSKHVVAVSDYMKEKFLSLTKLESIKQKITVVTNGIDNELFYKRSVNLHEKLGIEGDAKILLSVGRLTIKKGYKRKLSLFRRLSQRHKVHWIIVGQGEYEEKLLNAIQENRLQNSVSILNNIDRESLAEYYSGADLFWLLSEYDESFGLVYLEANFCGCPVIGNNKGGIPYVIDNGVNGFVVNPDDDEKAYQQIESVLFEDPIKRDNIAKFSSRFSLKRVQSKLDCMLD